MDDSDSAVKSDNNKEDTNDAAEITGLNEVTETGGDNEAVVAGGGGENSVSAAEEVVAGVLEEPEMVDGEDEIGVGEGVKEEATDVAEGMEKTEMAEDIGEVKGENENEAEVEEKKVEAMEESKVAEVEGVVGMEKPEETEAFNETGEVDEMKTEGKVEEEEIDVANAAEEMQVTEEAEAMEEGNDAEDIEGHEVKVDNAEEIVEGHEIEGSNAEDIEEGHKMERDNAEDIVEGHGTEGDNAEIEGHNIERDNAEGHGTEGDIAEIEEGHNIERDNADDIVEVHEIGDNTGEIGGGHEIEVDNAENIEEGHEIGDYNAEIDEGHEIERDNVEDIGGDNEEEIEGGDNAEEIEGHEIDGDNAEEIEGHEIDGYNAEETEEGHEIEEDNADEIEEGDNAEEIGGDNAEEIEGDNAEEMEEGDNEENVEMADGTEEAAADEVEEFGRTLAGKRKRGKNAKAPVRTPSKKKAEEDVCFICFDGGELVLCDRRGCPKAYHPTCVNRDDAFFQTKGRWNCGWHICSNCEKNAYYMCYTCTFSLCKGCVKDSVILCVRGNKGFCETCMKTIMLIESNEQGNKETAQVDFDDRSSFEYLFKDYWVDLKGKLSLTVDELSQAKNPWKGSESSVGKRESRDELYDVENDGGSGSDDSSGKPEVNSSKRKRAKKRLKSHSKERDSKISKKLNGAREALTDDGTGWASKELLEFVMHMKNGDRSVCSQFDVQALLLEYIKRNKLRDPRRKSQIICDSRLEKLFGKSRVGHFEMLKLLESHFLLKEDSQADDLQGGVFDTEANQSEVDGSGKDRRRKSRKKNDGRGLQSNLDDYAAIDTNNINLIYLRRSLVENLLDDTETFHDKVVGAFVRIRISGSAQKQDLYRLVQVVGTSKAAEPYKVGKKTTEFLLEILNLNKTEIVSIDIISNQDFTEDECKRLRQSIKCGLIDRLTVGDVQEKALALQAVRVEDALETEITRISHLCDRASDMGKRKELRECVEKLQRLKSPDERRRRLEEIPEVHADPNMDPSYESEEDEDQMDDKKQENYLRSGGSSFNRRGRDPVSPARASFSSTNRELSRNLSSKSFSMKGEDVYVGGDMVNENLWSADKEMLQSQTRERPKTPSNLDSKSVRLSLPQEPVPSVKPEIPVVPPTPQINETEKIWHYKDPSGKTQGPFSMVQLRKWNNTGYFPVDLRIWRVTESQDDSILLTAALAGNFQREPRKVESHPRIPLVQSQFEISNSTPLATPTPLEISGHSTDKWESETNLPSPTPGQGGRSGTRGQPRESRWSPTPVGPTSLGVSNGETRHGGLVMAQSGQQLLHSPIPSGSQRTVNSGNLQGLLSQSTIPGESPKVQGGSHLVLTPDSGVAPVNVANFQTPVQGPPQGAANSNQPSAYGGWATTTVQPSAAPNAPWGMGVTDQQATTPRPGPENQTTGWGPIPGNTNMGWRGPVPANPNQNWVAPSHSGPGPAPGNANPGWTGHANTGWAGPAQGQPPVSPYPGWAPHFQGPGPGQLNNQGWVAPGQGPPQGTVNPNQPPAKPNMGSWGNEKGGERFSSRRDGGDSSYGGGKPWNRQQQQNRGDSSRAPFKGQRVCKYHESGHCKKGAACDYLHT